MHPQITNIQASAQDAFEHIFESAGALVFVNEYSGSAAPPAPYNAFAEHKLACPLTQLYHTLGEHTCSTKRPKNLRPSLASTGPMPNMLFAYKLRAPSNESTAVSSTHQKPLMRGCVPCRSDSQENRSPFASNFTKAPSSLPCANTTSSCSFPLTP